MGNSAMRDSGALGVQPQWGTPPSLPWFGVLVATTVECSGAGLGPGTPNCCPTPGVRVLGLGAVVPWL